jgi:cobalt-zinc-cadmium efflux system outer membrane protein
MSRRLAAVAAWFAAIAMAQSVAAAQTMTLDDAFARVAATHPELRLAQARGDILAVEVDAASQRPALTAGVELENAPGIGNLEGVRGAETTLTLASVLERGGKPDARRTLARSRVDAQGLESEARRLDLLAEVARRYLAASAALHQRDIAVRDVALRQRTVAAARDRLQAGASPESVVLSAEAMLAVAELAQARATQQWIAARMHLAVLWGEPSPDFGIAAGNPLALPAVPDSAALAALLEGTPELQRFASERRIAEARLQLARTAATPDLGWQVGFRHLNEGDDLALVAGISMPLGSRRRAEPGIRAANAELAALQIEREAGKLSLHSTLQEAHGRYLVAQLEVTRLGDEVLPLLARAEAATERAWSAGAASYMELSQLQSELTTTHRRRLEVALEAQRALIEIQRLTGQAFVAGPANTQGTTP